jgi:hypothetical protein
MKHYFEVIVEHFGRKIYCDGYLTYTEHVKKSDSEKRFIDEVESIDLNPAYYLDEDKQAILTPDLKKKIEEKAINCLN